MHSVVDALGDDMGKRNLARNNPQLRIRSWYQVQHAM
jgi:hypothetical protein